MKAQYAAALQEGWKRQSEEKQELQVRTERGGAGELSTGGSDLRRSSLIKADASAEVWFG